MVQKFPRLVHTGRAGVVHLVVTWCFKLKIKELGACNLVVLGRPRVIQPYCLHCELKKSTGAKNTDYLEFTVDL